MMISERKELLNRLSDAIREQQNIKYSVLIYLTGVVNRAEYLSVEQKEALLREFWRNEE